MGRREVIAMDVQKLADIHGRNLRAPAIQHWVNRLEPHSESIAYRRVMNEMCDGARMPSLADVVADICAKSSNEWKAPVVGPRTAKDDHSAIMSMLWLYYEKSWPLTDFAGHVMGRMLGKDPYPSLVAALEIYDRASVSQWMEIEIRKGN